MAPTPKVWNPIAPIQDNWSKIKPWHEGYMNVLGGLGTIFGFASTIALIVSHNFKLPKWPFTMERWNPKPTEVKEQEEKDKEVSKETLIEDELALAAGGAMIKRSIGLEMDTDEEGYRRLARRDKNIVEELEDEADKVKNETAPIGDKIKSVWEEVEKDAKEMGEDVKEVAKEVWDDVKEIFGGKGDSESQESVGNKTGAALVHAKRTGPIIVTRHRRAVSFID